MADGSDVMDGGSRGRLDVVSMPGLDAEPWLRGLRATWLGEAVESPWSRGDRAAERWLRTAGLGADPKLCGYAMASHHLGHGIHG